MNHVIEMSIDPREYDLGELQGADVDEPGVVHEYVHASGPFLYGRGDVLAVRQVTLDGQALATQVLDLLDDGLCPVDIDVEYDDLSALPSEVPGVDAPQSARAARDECGLFGQPEVHADGQQPCGA